MRRFERITISNCLQLIKTLVDVGTRKESLVRQVYSTYAIDYEETSEFLAELGLFEREGNDCWLATELPPERNPVGDAKTGREFLVDLIRRQLIEGNSEYSRIAISFLNRFEIRNERFCFTPRMTEKLQTSAVRNLLIELEVLDHDDNTGEYLIINSDVVTALLTQRVNPVNSVDYESLLRMQQQIGRLAEEEVLKFERSRLCSSPELATMVEHVALVDISAGYDIRSYEESADPSGNHNPRYIEVKAVPKSNYRFYWSRNEIEVARMLGDRYFLYLVPVASVKSVILEEMKIIANPTALFSDTHWIHVAESYRLEHRSAYHGEEAYEERL